MVDRKGVAVRHGHHCTMPLHSLLGVSATTRASFGVYHTRGDIDVLVDAIEFARKKLRLEQASRDRTQVRSRVTFFPAADF